MASVHKTRTGKWEVRFRQGDQNRSRTFKTKEEARGFQAEVERSEFAPLRPKDVPTLGDYANEWLARRDDLADSTRKQYAQWLAFHILPERVEKRGGLDSELGNMRLNEIESSHVKDWQHKRLDAGAGPVVLAKAQTLLSQILDEAVVDGYREYNPVASVKRPRRKKGEKRKGVTLTAVQVEGIREWYLAHDDFGSATLVSVLAYIGIRPQDALALEWRDFDDDLIVNKKNTDGVIVAGSKTNEDSERKVYIPVQVRADLNGWRDRIPHAKLIFPNRDGKPWTAANYNNWRFRKRTKKQQAEGLDAEVKCFKRAVIETGLPESTRPYDLRHTAASLYANAGWNHLEIAHQLGHSPEVSMRVYQHIIDFTPGRERLSIEDMIAAAREQTCSEVRSESVRRNAVDRESH